VKKIAMTFAALLLAASAFSVPPQENSVVWIVPDNVVKLQFNKNVASCTNDACIAASERQIDAFLAKLGENYKILSISNRMQTELMMLGVSNTFLFSMRVVVEPKPNPAVSTIVVKPKK
jgi:hypothetical protein